MSFVGCDHFVPRTVFWALLYLLFLRASIMLELNAAEQSEFSLEVAEHQLW